MAAKKTVVSRLNAVNVVRLKDVLGKFLVISKITSFLSIVFYIIWIAVGIFFIWFIAANFRLGAFDQLMTGKSAISQDAQQPSGQTPTETDIPGIGKVNISCVQSNLSQEAIVKIVQGGGTGELTDEEKSKLEPCIVEKESAAPTASPKQ